MRVLIFMTQFYQLNGAERLAVELAEELNKNGVHADIMSMYTRDLPGVHEAINHLLAKGIPEIHFLDLPVHPPLWKLFPTILKLRKLLHEQGYDIVETSMVSPTGIASWATRGTKTRHIAGLHRVFKTGRENSRQHKFWRFSVRCNKHLRYYAISDYAAKGWVAYSGTPSEYTRRIYNAISDDYFVAEPDRIKLREELGIAQDERIALFVGRLAPLKGIDTLLEALGPILQENKLVLLYAGLPDLHIEGAESTLQQMEQTISENKWDNRVKFLGYRKDGSRLMASSDILVHPARIEGFGLVLAEAMAAGLPVVASNVEGIPEVLSGTDSIMVPPDHPEALREAVLKTLQRPPQEMIRAMSKGKERAERFRTEKRTQAMIELFEDILLNRF